MKLLIIIFRFHLEVIYFILKLFKVNNKIVFLSRQSNEETLDFSLLINELKNRDNNIKIVVLCKKLNHGLLNKIKYYFHMYSQMYHLATSKVCITDSYSPVISILHHKKRLKIIQIWHSLGAIKKFGYQTLGTTSGRNEELSKSANMHKNYDYIISGSKAMTKYFALAFNYPQDKFRNYGLPRIDYLKDNKEKLSKEIYNSFPHLNDKNKINVLYAPTFRTYQSDETEQVINAFNDEKYNLIVKSHMNQKLQYRDNKVMTCDNFTALQLLAVTDYLITDYSGIAIEGSVIDVKTLYYVYDYDEYIKNNGLNIDLYKEMPNCVYKNIKDIEKIINENNYNNHSLEKYKKKYLPNIDKSCTEKIVDLIEE